MSFGKEELLAYMRSHRLAVVSTIGGSGGPESADAEQRDIYYSVWPDGRDRLRWPVRRQLKRVRTGLCGREALAHLLSDVRRRFGGSSSVGSRWCVV